MFRCGHRFCYQCGADDGHCSHDGAPLMSPGPGPVMIGVVVVIMIFYVVVTE